MATSAKPKPTFVDRGGFRRPQLSFVDLNREPAPTVKPGSIVYEHHWYRISNMLRDASLVVLTAIAVSYLGAELVGANHFQRFKAEHSFYLLFAGTFAAFTVICCDCNGLYRAPRAHELELAQQAASLGRAVLVSTALVAALLWISGTQITSLARVASTGALSLLTLTGSRVIEKRRTLARLAAGRGMRNALIIGAGKTGRQLAMSLQSNPQFGFALCGFIDDHVQGPHVIGTTRHFAEIARAQFADVVFITLPWRKTLIRRIAAVAAQNHIDVRVVPELYDFRRGPRMAYVGGFPTLDLHREPIPAAALVCKRALDITASLLGLIALSPLLLAIAIAIKVESRGPALYWSARAGKKGRSFQFCKFRTMVVNADALKEKLRVINERRGPCFKIDHDPRITGVGRFLRRYSLDELPQLWNVLVGDMSLVGPRPHPLDDYRQYSLDNLRRLDVTPGITGLWQVKARRDPSWEVNMALDLQYIENWSVLLDLGILLQTLPAVLRGSGQ